MGPIAEDRADASHGSKEDVERGMSSSSSSEDLMMVPNPYADAVPLPSKASINAAAARHLAHSTSATDSTASSLESTDSHTAIQNWVQQHYNVGDDVVLRAEFIPENQMKAVLIGVWVSEALATVFLVLGVGLKLGKSQTWFLRHRAQEIFNIVIASPCWSALFVGAFLYLRRLLKAYRSHKRWSHRRKKVILRTVLEHTIVFINVTSYLITSIYLLSGRCRWFSGFVSINGTIQWTCWNATFALFVIHAHDSNPWVRCTGMRGFRPDAIIMDAPRTYHLPKLYAFLVVESLIVAAGVLNYRSSDNRSMEAKGQSCELSDYHCSISTAETVLISITVACFIGYFVVVLYFVQKAYAMLREKPYTSMRMANQNIRLQARLRGLAMAFFVLCTVLYVYVGWGTCVSYLQSWLGFLPMVIVMTGVTVVSTYLTMPNNPTENVGILQVWLQEFAWSEAELPRRRDERRSSLCASGPCPMDKEPMFCFETSLKMLYWSMLVYRYEEADLRGVTLEGAMALYKLTEFELMWERKLDTKALMAWNSDTIVLAFRGTASFKNVLADIKAWYATHPPRRGQWYLGSRPFVHQGFLRSWLASGLREKVVSRVNEVVQGLKAKGGVVRVYVTGHSLGGALATLAAFDIQAACKCLPRMSLAVYTFGAPRTGNHAFAREYNQKVPETWNVINDQDTVPRSGKFGVLYKRPGQRVLINSDGDMIVRPSFVEAAAQRRATSSVAHHLLVNYQRAHIAIIKAQFTVKRLRDGMAGVLQIAEACGMQNLLKAAGVEYEDLKKLQRFGDSGIPALPSISSTSHSGILGKHLRKASHSTTFSLDFDVAAVAAIADEEDAKAKLAVELKEERIQQGVDALSRASEEVQAAAAIAVLDRGVKERPSVEEAEATLASGGDFEVDDGQPTPPAHVAIDVSDAHDASRASAAAPDAFSSAAPTAVSHERAASDGSEGVSRADSAGEVPDVEAPLQHYAGSLAAGHCRYTHFNGRACKASRPGARRSRDGGFCYLKDRPKEPNVVEGAAEGPFCRLTDRPLCLKMKLSAAVGDGVNRFLGR